jgi:type II secretory pathway pseudopilin PulG
MWPRRAESSSESGVTLIELGVVLAAAASGLVSISDAAKSTQDRSEAISELRLAVERIAKDARAANPIDAIDAALPVTTYETSLSFSVYCASGPNCGTDNLRRMTYRVVDNRLEMVTNGTVSTLIRPDTTSFPPSQSKFAIVNSPAEPVFAYFDRDGDRLETSGGTAVSRITLRDCTRTVRIHLRMVAESGDLDNPISLVTSVTLRNFNEVTGC